MKQLELHSGLADPIRRFVEYKRALNRKYRSEAAALRFLINTSATPGSQAAMKLTAY
jgi:hypothetical protein